MSTSKTGNFSFTGWFHGRTFFIDSSLGRYGSPLLHDLPFLGCLYLFSPPRLFFPSWQLSALFSGRSFSPQFCSYWPPFWPPSPPFYRALAGFFHARPWLHATRSRSCLIGVLSPSKLVQVGLRPPSFMFCFSDGPPSGRLARI